MKLPEITQEILDKFGASGGVGIKLIEWRCSYNGDMEPQWTQAAVDFAKLLELGESENVAELEAELKKAQIECGHLEAQLNDVNGQLAKDTCYLCNFLERGDCHAQKENLHVEIERMRPVVKAVARWRRSYEVLKLHRGEVSDLLFSMLSEYEIENVSEVAATELLKDLESAGRALLAWDKKYPKDQFFDFSARIGYGKELTALIERFRALLEKKP